MHIGTVFVVQLEQAEPRVLAGQLAVDIGIMAVLLVVLLVAIVVWQPVQHSIWHNSPKYSEVELLALAERLVAISV